MFCKAELMPVVGRKACIFVATEENSLDGIALTLRPVNVGLPAGPVVVPGP